MTGDAASATSGPGGRLLLVVFVAGLLSQAVLVAQQQSTGGPGQSPETLVERYRQVITRNIFSRFARSPQPPPEARRPERPPAPPPPEASYILSGVITGGNENLALVEDSSTRQTHVFRQGAETPLGRLETITSEGISILAGAGLRTIPVGYTLSGERSAKLASTMTLASGSSPSPTSSSEASAAASRFRGRGGWPGAPGTGSAPAAGGEAAPVASAGETSPAARAEILQRLRERRLRETGQGEGGAQSSGAGSEGVAEGSASSESQPEQVEAGGATDEQ